MESYNSVFGTGGHNDEVDADELVADIGLDAEEIAWRKAFVDFDDDDARRLRALSGTFRDHDDEIADRFYDNLTSFDDTEAIIDNSPKDVEQLKQTQRAYWVTLTAGEYGEEYFRNRARIGKLHDLLDMPAKHYIGQYGVYFELLLSVLTERVQDDVTDHLRAAGVGEDTIEAVRSEIDDGSQDALSALKLMNLDMQVAMDTYIDAHMQQVQAEIERRKEIAEETQTAAQDLQNFANDVSKSSQRISDLTDNEAGNMDEIRTEMSNLSATIEEIAATSSEVEATSERAVEAAEDGQASATTAIDVMEDIQASADEIETDVQNLSEQTEEIDEVITVINDIADQTNLLALNASIEAARAGEAGDGFAVVADEVKSLAEESQSQADRIEQTIVDIQDDIERTADTIDETAGNVETGIEQVENAMEQLDEIAAVVKDAAVGVEEVADATDEQAAVAEQIAGMLDDATDRISEINEEIDEIATANEQQTAKVFKVTSDLRQLSDDV